MGKYDLLWLDWAKQSGLDVLCPYRMIDLPATDSADGNAELLQTLSTELLQLASSRGWQLPATNISSSTDNGCPSSVYPPERASQVSEGHAGTWRFVLDPGLHQDRFHLAVEAAAGMELPTLVLSSGGGAGLLYGFFYTVAAAASGRLTAETIREQAGQVIAEQEPAIKLRMLLHGDHSDDSVDRGYAGPSLLFRYARPAHDRRVRDYARLLCSLGINAICMNSPDVSGDDVRLLHEDRRDDLARFSELFQSYGISVYISVDFVQPGAEAGIADPGAPGFADWWQQRIDALFADVPLLAGFLVQCPAERGDWSVTEVAAANKLARQLAGKSAHLLWCSDSEISSDWRTVPDLAGTSFDSQSILDGQFEGNVLLQVSPGPTGNQVSEPPNPLIAALPATRIALTVEVTQQFTGQQTDLCYLAQAWQQLLRFAFDDAGERSVAGRLSGSWHGQSQPSCLAGLANTGRSANWCGHDLATANWFAFGRLAWDPEAEASMLCREWMTLTLGSDPRLEPVLGMLMDSYGTYRKYTAPLGIGGMFDVQTKYGPSFFGHEFSGSGLAHGADCRAIGHDRSGQRALQFYPEAVRERIVDPAGCPEEWLLFFHRLPYGFVMKDGRTLLQRIYDDHFDGVRAVKQMQEIWQTLEPALEPGLFRRVAARFDLQLVNAQNWRDEINTGLYRLSGIGDERSRHIYP